MRPHTGSRQRTRTWRRLLPGAGAVLLGVLCGSVVLATRPAQAASCCGSILARADRLGPGEKAAIQLGGTALLTPGWFLDDGHFAPLSQGDLHLDGSVLLGGAFRVHDAFQVGVTTGWQQGFRRYGDTGETGGWLTDATVGLRFEPESLREWAFTATALLPLGKTVEESGTTFGSNVTGRGSFGLRLGAFHEAAFAEWFISTDVGVTAHGPERTSGIDANLSADATVLAGYSFRSAAGLAAGLRGTIAPPWSRRGERLSPHVRSRVGVLIAGGVPLDARWTVTGSVTVDPPVGVSRNEPMQVGASAGVRLLLGW